MCESRGAAVVAQGGGVRLAPSPSGGAVVVRGGGVHVAASPSGGAE